MGAEDASHFLISLRTLIGDNAERFPTGQLSKHHRLDGQLTKELVANELRPRAQISILPAPTEHITTLAGGKPRWNASAHMDAVPAVQGDRCHARYGLPEEGHVQAALAHAAAGVAHRRNVASVVQTRVLDVLPLSLPSKRLVHGHLHSARFKGPSD